MTAFAVIIQFENNTVAVDKDKTRLQALALLSDCCKYIMDLTTDGVVITNDIKFVQNSKEKLIMSNQDENKESKELAYNDDQKLEEEKEKITTN